MLLGIRQKLAIAFATASLLITAIAFVAMLFSFRAGFLQYINDHRYQSLAAFNQTITQQVISEAQWQRLVSHPKYWHDLIAANNTGNEAAIFLEQSSGQHQRRNRPRWDDQQRPPPRHRRHDYRDKPDRGRYSDRPVSKRPPPPRRGPVSVFVLLDQHHQVIYGKMQAQEDMWQLPIIVDAKTVGYVALSQLKHFNSDADKVFVAEQTRYFLWIAIAAAVIALLMAWLLARWMVVPIQRLDKAMSALMQRDYKAQVHYDSKDEIGRLVGSFNQLAKALGDYDQTQQQWIADISHELRTPIATLRGEIEALQEGIRTLSQARLHSLHEEVLRLQRIVDDLHQLSLSDAGALRYVFDDVGVAPVIQQVLERSQGLLNEQDLRYDINVVGKAKTIYGDEDRLAQLFGNLLQNTLRYTDRGGRLCVTLTFSQNNVRIVWEDSEPGVLSASLERLFDRLYREDKSRNREKGGSGLGLSICRSIVEAHQGQIVAEQSTLGGLAIAIIFPVIE